MERHNPWWVNEPDIGFEQWKEAKVNWVPEVVNKITLKPFSLHFLSGPRQVGKTTAVKILIQRLIMKRPVKSVFYYSCDELTDFRELGEVLDNYLAARAAWNISGSVILLDEITFVDEWWRAVKARIDSGAFKKDVLVVTGSARIELLKQKETFPGRRGGGKDLVLHPLDFSSFVKVKGDLNVMTGDISELDKNVKANKLFSKKLSELFKEYMMTGGFPRSIQDRSRYQKVTNETSRTYLDWLRGDWSRVGKSDRFMKEILSYLMRAEGTPVSWNSISNQTSINSPNTVRSYIETLEGIQSVLVLNFMAPSSRIDYKKNKKIHFTDPFIYRVIGDYVNQEVAVNWLLEAAVASHLSRLLPVYYWRNHTEVDIVCLRKKRQIGFEVTKGLKKWKAPWHIKKSYLLDKNTLPIYLSALKSD
ncbi:MAG: ATP-binding protein [Thermoplasmata archaeon]|nr:MAG: ATP-binding protein [Thermoplasmata archaeon]